RPRTRTPGPPAPCSRSPPSFLRSREGFGRKLFKPSGRELACCTGTVPQRVRRSQTDPTTDGMHAPRHAQCVVARGQVVDLADAPTKPRREDHFRGRSTGAAGSSTPLRTVVWTAPAVRPEGFLDEDPHRVLRHVGAHGGEGGRRRAQEASQGGVRGTRPA